MLRIWSGVWKSRYAAAEKRMFDHECCVDTREGSGTEGYQATEQRKAAGRRGSDDSNRSRLRGDKASIRVRRLADKPRSFDIVQAQGVKWSVEGGGQSSRTERQGQHISGGGQHRRRGNAAFASGPGHIQGVQSER
eukprot:TRINITY_DN26128_c0_g1_i1.p2 TRINITY_DN26128_c0_g1~~TRINITY_DN26128_c0_g1_i1.p2  ORF type:complete len:136 (-),score=17.03 TRINITY_DN26128_c0_g1_i1:166-573(-)